MPNTTIADGIAEMHPDTDMMQMDGYDDCIIGVAMRFGMQPLIAYDVGLVINKLEKEGMTHEEAWEWFHYNMIGGWFGEGTPVFIDTHGENIDA